jgi:hypothetical protein
MLRAFNEEFLAALGERSNPAGEAAAHGQAVELMREIGAKVFEERLLAHPLRCDEVSSPSGHAPSNSEQPGVTT